MTETEICRLALDHIGATSIAELSETSKEAQLCRRLYAPCRDQVLRDHAWNFALTHARLASVAIDDADLYRFAYAYVYPADCLRAIEIDRGGLDIDPIEFRILRMNAYQGRVVLTDQENAILIYIAQVTQTGQFDPMFAMALSYRLAAELAMPLTGKESIVQGMTQMYQQQINTAGRADAEEGHTRAQNRFTTFLDAR